MQKYIIFFLLSFYALGAFSQESVEEGFSSSETAFEEESNDNTTSDKVHLVEEEYIPIKYNNNYLKAIPSYKERRRNWGFLFGLSVSMFQPDSYEPNFNQSFDFVGLYGDDFNGLFELTGSAKWNLDFGSLGFGLGAGYYTVNSLSGSPNDSTLTVIPVRAEVSFMLDTLMDEPKYVPYVLGGVYTNFYTESQASVTFNGNTEASFYMGVGVNFQLDWLEPKAGLNSYLDYGIENTFLYLEGRKFIASSAIVDPNFETGFQLAMGAKFEY